MDLIKKCLNDLKQLVKCNNIKERRIKLKEANNCLIDAISEISKNFLLGNIKIKPKTVKLLRPYRKVIEFISKKKPLNIRKQKIIQKGGFLNILIPSALYLLEKLIKNE